ncbi:hypothetical protein BDP27DRAFT_1317751 [Rhodocollybia butyracea]|uniref:Uncharacterized protein n=1 Tax=Rhodocollybia butyracea TaxID=206335 RepID=A0A9P5Q3D7_9AGAR|nr:hypothetical protein BDP27DRAFT_1317751 [Rhodocollybia butyracea]
MMKNRGARKSEPRAISKRKRQRVVDARISTRFNSSHLCSRHLSRSSSSTYPEFELDPPKFNLNSSLPQPAHHSPRTPPSPVCGSPRVKSHRHTHYTCGALGLFSSCTTDRGTGRESIGACPFARPILEDYFDTSILRGISC